MLGVPAQRIARAYSQAAQQRRWGHCAETRRDGAQLPTARAICRRAARPWGLPRASRRFAHLIPESRRRGHAGLIQRFPRRILSRSAEVERPATKGIDSKRPPHAITSAAPTVVADE